MLSVLQLRSLHDLTTCHGTCSTRQCPQIFHNGGKAQEGPHVLQGEENKSLLSGSKLMMQACLRCRGLASRVPSRSTSEGSRCTSRVRNKPDPCPCVRRSQGQRHIGDIGIQDTKDFCRRRWIRISIAMYSQMELNRSDSGSIQIRSPCSVNGIERLGLYECV